MEQSDIKELAETTQRSKSNAKRIDKLEARQDNLDKLATAMATFDTEQKHIKKDVTEIKADVKGLADKPGKRWDALVEKSMWLVIGGLLAYALSQIGL